MHKVTEYKADPSTAVQAMAQEHTYQAPAAQQHLLPKTGSEDKSSIAIVGFVGMFLGLLMIREKERIIEKLRTLKFLKIKEVMEIKLGTDF